MAALLATLACRSTEDLGGLRTQVLDDPEAYELEIVGHESFLRGTLQKAASADLNDFLERDFARAPADDAAYTVESFYHARGFHRAKVTYEIERPEDGKPKLVLRVEEGPRAVIGDVHFEGATVFSRENLEKLIGGPTTSILGLGEVYFVESNVRSARGSIEELYWENGYLEVAVEPPEIEFNEEGTRADLRYTLFEGPQYLLREVRIQNLEGEDAERAREGLDKLIGKPYFPRLAFEARSAASSWFARHGYPEVDAQATEIRDEEAARVDLELHVEKGERVRISEVRVEGNERTRTAFLLQRISLEPGDLFDRAAERRAFGELYSTGLFRSIEIELVGEGPERPLVVKVVEVDTLSLSVEVGYGAFERARVIVGITEENIAGTGRALRIEGKLAEKAESARIFLTDPWTLGKDNILGFTTFYDLREEPGFDSTEVGFGVNLTRPVTPNFRNVFGYEYRFSDASNVDVDVVSSTIADGEGDYISALYITNLYDSRDSLFLPRDGTWMRLRSELAPEQLASELAFARVEGRLAKYHPFDDETVFAWTVSTGLIFPTQGTDEIPLQERFFNGGQNTVRSFKESELGPKDANGHPVGGETYFLASAEIRHRLPASFVGALFVDAGNVTLETDDYFEFADIRYAVGPGLRWLLPIGPLRLDWGINPDPREDERDWVLQFSVGVAF